jgi:TolB-like protein/Flp pilus assembly protein TadD
MKNFFAQVKSRNIRKTLTIYMSTALTSIGILRLFMEVYGLPAVIFPITVSVLTCGVASAFLVGWYHGTEGQQAIRRKEIVLHSVIILGAALLVVNVVERSRQPRLGAAREGKSIAVLPFKNMSDNRGDEYFSDGMMEDILTQLSKIGDLRVISRTSVMKYKETQLSIREIGEDLGVAAILEGSVRRVGDRIRIAGQLIDVATDEHIWAETYDRDMKDVFAIQSDVAQRISEALKAQLQPNEKRLIEKKATESMDAYAYYLRGRDLYYRLTRDDNERAVEFFKKAIALDPHYALAFTGLADAYAQRVQRYGLSAEWADSSIELSKHAIELDPDLADAYKSLGLAYFQREWYASAIEQYRKALSLNPNYASAYANMGEVMLWTGRQDEAIRLVRKAVALSPGRASFHSMLGNAYAELEMDSSSLYWFTKAIELQPSLTPLYVGLGELYLAQGNITRAREVLHAALAREPEIPLLLSTAGNVELYDRKYEAGEALFRKAYDLLDEKFEVATQLAYALSKTGKTGEAKRLLDEAYDHAEADLAAQTEEGIRRYELACIWAMRGNRDEAMRWLRESIRLGARSYRLTVRDPLLENLHGVPGFVHLMDQLRSEKTMLKSRVEAEDRAENGEAG